MSGLARTRWRVVGMIAVAAILSWAWFTSLERVLRTGEMVARVPGEVAESLERAAKGFLHGDVTYRFLSSIPTVEAPRAGRLELAIATTVETVERTDERRAFWDLVPLGSTTVGIRVPVVWRYYVALDEPWRATVQNRRMTVLAPPLRPSLPPALRTDKLERRVASDWLRFDGDQQLARLERELLPMLVVRARDARHLALVREPARRALTEFAQAWLLGQGAWGPGEVQTIDVRFADEPEQNRETVPGPRVGGDPRG